MIGKTKGGTSIDETVRLLTVIDSDDDDEKEVRTSTSAAAKAAAADPVKPLLIDNGSSTKHIISPLPPALPQNTVVVFIKVSDIVNILCNILSVGRSQITT